MGVEHWQSVGQVQRRPGALGGTCHRPWRLAADASHWPAPEAYRLRPPSPPAYPQPPPSPPPLSRTKPSRAHALCRRWQPLIGCVQKTRRSYNASTDAEQHSRRPEVPGWSEHPLPPSTAATGRSIMRPPLAQLVHPARVDSANVPLRALSTPPIPCVCTSLTSETIGGKVKRIRRTLIRWSFQV